MQRILVQMLAPLALVAIVASAADAQRPLTVGITGGVNFANISAERDLSNKSNLIGFFVGGMLSMPMMPMWDLYAEASWSRKGVKGQDEGTDIELRTSYIDFPVMLRVMPAVTGQARPWFGFGAYGAVNLDCEIEGSEGGVSVTFDCDEAELDVESFDYGLIAGAGVNFNQFGAFARYQFGLAELTDGSDAKNRTIQVGVSWSFMR